MRRLFGVLALCSSLAMIAAAPPAPKATATPKATPITAASPTLAPNAPALLVYPFEAPSDVNSKDGATIAQIFTQVIAQGGSVKLLPIPEKIKREDYATFARVQHADYYISGYIQPIGQAAAIVTQIVDVSTGIMVYSTTTQISSVQDVGSQALTARSVILAQSGVDRPAISQTGNATPTPSATSGAQLSITDVIGGLFKGKSKASSPKPGETPTPLPKPKRGIIIARTIGNAQPGELTVATDDLYRALDAHYTAAITTLPPAGNVAKQADTICGTHRDNSVASGVLDVSRSGGIRSHNTYTFTLNIYTCFGATLYTNTQTGTDRVKTIHDAADAYANDHPDND